MQSLYAFFQTENDNISSAERDLLRNINKIYDLYLSQLLMLVELTYTADRVADIAKSKHFPSEKDNTTEKKFSENNFLKKLSENEFFIREVKKRSVSWSEKPELIKKLYQLIRTTEEYKKYIQSEKSTASADKDLILKLYKNYLGEHPDLMAYYEEKSIYWVDDIEIVHMMILKTFKILDKFSDNKTPLAPLFDDAAAGDDVSSEDRKFLIDLFRKTIINNKKFENMISEKTKNWEIDRIAMIDILLMKMALCEITEFHTIPVKVTLNEYIEISKLYSSAKSKIFINGILDKMVIELKSQGLVKKIGRGLIDFN